MPLLDCIIRNHNTRLFVSFGDSGWPSRSNYYTFISLKTYLYILSYKIILKSGVVIEKNHVRCIRLEISYQTIQSVGNSTTRSTIWWAHHIALGDHDSPRALDHTAWRSCCAAADCVVWWEISTRRPLQPSASAVFATRGLVSCYQLHLKMDSGSNWSDISTVALGCFITLTRARHCFQSVACVQSSRHDSWSGASIVLFLFFLFLCLPAPFGTQ